jgi:hypothetical protein
MRYNENKHAAERMHQALKYRKKYAGVWEFK